MGKIGRTIMWIFDKLLIIKKEEESTKPEQFSKRNGVFTGCVNTIIISLCMWIIILGCGYLGWQLIKFIINLFS